MELLAPAGSREALIAAVQSGADAVYLGGSKFSARGSAKNFDEENMREMIDYCHIRGVSVHVAANTLIKENEVNSFLEYIGTLNDMGVDAVIIQDIGMARCVHKLYPDLPIHASTQMTCASIKTAKKLEEMGFSRIVLARELSYSEIEKIKKSVNVEIEVFVHGAICMSYSGQCLMSSMIGGRSGNRGLCAQPCRLSYKFLQNGKDVNSGYLLSPKDMCLVDHLEKLRNIGVDSLKIEGRLKRAEYVSAVVGVYKKCIDEKRKATLSEQKELTDAFNRSGFTDGYFVNKLGVNMMTYENPSNVGENVFSNEAKTRCRNDIELRKVPVRIEACLYKSKPLVLKMTDFDGNFVEVTGKTLSEIANNKPLTKERLEEQLSKLGNTPFEASDIDVHIDDGIIIPIGEINGLRREAVEELMKNRTIQKDRRKIEYSLDVQNKSTSKPILSAKVRNVIQAKACISSGIKRIYAPYEVICQISDDVELVQIMPPIEKEDRNKPDVISQCVLINSLGQLEDNQKKYYGDYRFNVFNSQALKSLESLSCVTISPELTINEIKAIKKPIETELIVYGRIPLMTFENCPVKAHSKCDGQRAYNELVDRKNERFPLMCGVGCFCELLNSKPIFMADKLSDLSDIGIGVFRLDFTVEDEEECKKIIEAYKMALDGKEVKPLKENTFTRGHFYRKTD